MFQSFSTLNARQRLVVLILCFLVIYFVTSNEEAEPVLRVIRPRIEPLNQEEDTIFDDQFVFFSSRPRSFVETWSVIHKDEPNSLENFKVVPGEAPISYGAATTTMSPSTFEFSASSSAPYLVGLLEGFLTSDHIMDYWKALNEQRLSHVPPLHQIPSDLMHFYQNNPCVIDHLVGVWHGYMQSCPPGKELNLSHFLWMNVAHQLTHSTENLNADSFLYGSSTSFRNINDQTEISQFFFSSIPSRLSFSKSYSFPIDPICGVWNNTKSIPVWHEPPEYHRIIFHGYPGVISPYNSIFHRTDSGFLVGSSIFWIGSNFSVESLVDSFLHHTRTAFFSKGLDQWVSYITDPKSKLSGQFFFLQFSTSTWLQKYIGKASVLNLIQGKESSLSNVLSQIQKESAFITPSIMCLEPGCPDMRTEFFSELIHNKTLSLSQIHEKSIRDSLDSQTTIKIKQMWRTNITLSIPNTHV